MASQSTETKNEQNGANVPDALIASFMREASETKRLVDETGEAHRTAKSSHQAVLKRAKNQGVNTRALLEAMAARKTEHDKVVIELRDTIRYLGLAGVPLKDSGLFDGSLVPVETDEQRQENAAWAADDAGYTSGKENGSREDNPFPPGSEPHGRWDEGWRRGVKARADAAKPGVAKASTRRAKDRAPIAANDESDTSIH